MTHLSTVLNLNNQAEDLAAQLYSLQQTIKVREWQLALLNLFNGGDKIQALLKEKNIGYELKTYPKGEGTAIEYTLTSPRTWQQRPFEINVCKNPLPHDYKDNPPVNVVFCSVGGVDLRLLGDSYLEALEMEFGDLPSYLKEIGA